MRWRRVSFSAFTISSSLRAVEVSLLLGLTRGTVVGTPAPGLSALGLSTLELPCVAAVEEVYDADCEIWGRRPVFVSKGVRDAGVDAPEVAETEGWRLRVPALATAPAAAARSADA